MFSLSRLIQVSVLVLCSSTTAWAQASRVWVSGTGNDLDPCSRTAPCKTFAGALVKVAAGGEINALDAGNYGPVTISKAVTIDGGATLASIRHTSPIGVQIDAPASAVVVLRNLTIDGGGAGMVGIAIHGAGSVVLENLLVTGELTSPGRGIDVATYGSPISVAVRDCTVTHNLNAGISSDGGGANVKLSIDHSVVAHTNYAVQTTYTTTLTITDSTVSQNVLGVAVESTSTAHVQHSTISQNRFGFLVGGPIALSACQITGNEMAFSPSSGHFEVSSHGNNAIIGNLDLGMTPVLIGLQ